jgi:hypothetical protein
MDLRALEPVLKHETDGVKPYHCHLFSVKKFLADGQHDRFESRMAVNGDRSSPTVVVHSIITCFTVASCNGYYRMRKTDVNGVFIQTEMESPLVFIPCNKQLATLMMKVISEVKEYATDYGI